MANPEPQLNTLDDFSIDLSDFRASPAEVPAVACSSHELLPSCEFSAGLPDFGKESREIVSPFDGEVINLDDPNSTDKLIRLLEDIKEIESQIYSVKPAVVREIASRTAGEAKTRRLMGQEKIAVVTMPGLSWDQSILKEAWNSFPKHRDTCLKIDEIGVRTREWGKIENTTGPDDFNAFRDMVAAACRGATGQPQVKIEK